MRALAERIQVEAIERKGQRVGLRFLEQTTLPPERLVGVARERRDLRLEPGGILWMDVKQGSTDMVPTLKTLLRHLQG